MGTLREWADVAFRDVAGNPVWAWAAALATALAVFVALLALRRSLTRRLRARAEADPGAAAGLLADLVGGVWSIVLLFAGLCAATWAVRLPDRLDVLLRTALVILALVQSGLWANAMLRRWLERRMKESTDGARSTAVLMLGFGGKLAVWALVLLLSLDNLGVDVTALIAGLGVGGIAVALAVQNVLGDLLGSVAIALDKPFEIGDFVIVGDFMGTVERIGLKTTRVRSLFGEQIVLSNGDLLSSRIRNYKRMKERRVVFTLGVTYQTSPGDLRDIPGIIREIVEAQPDVRFDRAHLRNYGDFSLVFEAVYYVLSPDFNLHMDRQQAIHLALFDRFAERKIEFAYPTQTLHLSGAAAPRAGPPAGGAAG